LSCPDTIAADESSGGKRSVLVTLARSFGLPNETVEKPSFVSRFS
jgi:hypothetical protein